MGEIATSNREIILFYNSKSILSNKILAYAYGKGLKLRTIDIIKTPLTGTQLEELADRLKIKIDGLIDKENQNYKKRFGNPDLVDRDWVSILKKNPEFLKYPIAIKGDKTIFVKIPSSIVKL